MTAPEGDGTHESTEVLIVRRARKRRAEVYRRRRITVAAAIVAVLALAGLGALALADDDGGSQVQAAGASTTSHPASSSTAPVSATALTTVAGATGTSSSTTVTPATPVCSSAGWSVEQRAAATVYATVGDESDLEASIAAGYGGIFFPGSSIGLVTDGTLKQRVDGLARAPLASTDEEGGRVQRLRDALGAIPSARKMHDLGPAQIRQLALDHGRKMAALGLTMDFAPVVDLVEDADLEGDGGIGDRSFSADAEEDAADAGAFAEGLDAAGILPTYKHFPGHGHASGDTHKGLVTTPSLAKLKTDDLIPYQRLLAAGQVPAAVMVGHLAVPGLTGGEPASVSKPAITGLLRSELGFDGLVVTDDLGTMEGILDRYTTVEAAERAVIAGADMVLVPATDGDQVVQRLVAAVADGRIPDQQLTASADRVLRAQQPDACSGA